MMPKTNTTKVSIMSDDLNTILETIRLNRHGIPSEKNCSLAALCGLDIEGAQIAARYNLEKNPSALSDRATAVLYWKTGSAAKVVLYDEWARAFCDYANWRDSFRVRGKTATFDTRDSMLAQFLKSKDFYCVEDFEFKSHELSPENSEEEAREVVFIGRNGILHLFSKCFYDNGNKKPSYFNLDPLEFGIIGRDVLLCVLGEIIERGLIIPRWFDEV
jgi:hypothetical protein